MNTAADIAATAREVSAKLSPSMLFMMGLNVIFVIALLWFVHDVSIARIEAVTRIFVACTTALTPK